LVFIMPVNIAKVCRLIDYTNLKPTATFSDIIRMIEEAEKYGFYGVCVNPIYVRFVKDLVSKGNIKVVTVISFPLGATPPSNKIYEAERAIKDGADELDIVSCISYLLSNRFDLFQNDVESVVSYLKREYPDIVIKVIVDLPYLNGRFSDVIANVINSTKPDFFKTSTGFAPRGTTVDDVLTFRELLSKDIKIKAAGGIRSYKQLLELVKAGASRIGTSTAIQIVEEARRMSK